MAGPCVDGSVRLLEDKTPMIYWNKRWYPICAARFSKDIHGANIFCDKLEFPSGNAVENSSVANVEDALMVGNCKSNDPWPHCTLGCNWMTIGDRCHMQGLGGKEDHTFTNCRKGFKPKLFITCSGPKTTRAMSSCDGKCLFGYISNSQPFLFRILNYSIR